MTAPIVVWNEIPVSDLDRAVTFYNAVFGWSMKIEEMEPNPVAYLGGSMDSDNGGHLYPGKPATDNGTTVHIAVEGKVEEAAERVWKAGGSVLSDAVEIPPGRFIYAKDPDGNSIGLFEPAKAA